MIELIFVGYFEVVYRLNSCYRFCSWLHTKNLSDVPFCAGFWNVLLVTFRLALDFSERNLKDWRFWSNLYLDENPTNCIKKRKIRGIWIYKWNHFPVFFPSPQSTSNVPVGLLCKLKTSKSSLFSYKEEFLGSPAKTEIRIWVMGFSGTYISWTL